MVSLHDAARESGKPIVFARASADYDEGPAISAAQAIDGNLLFALLTFVVYYNVITLSQAWVASGKLDMGTALIAAHGGALMLALGLMWWRDTATSRPNWIHASASRRLATR